jgi:iron-sulfur cluster repair protein YtfE (RIC family)
MLDEHFRQRAQCSDMERLAATEVPQPELARGILINLCRDLPLHFADEELSLLPRLRARARPEDEIETLIERLEAEHRTSQAALADLVAALICLADGALPAPEDRSALRALAQAHRRHLTLENAVLLPLARGRLTIPDRAAIMDEMRNRHAAPPEPQGHCARALARIGITITNNPEGPRP